MQGPSQTPTEASALSLLLAPAEHIVWVAHHVCHSPRQMPSKLEHVKPLCNSNANEFIVPDSVLQTMAMAGMPLLHNFMPLQCDGRPQECGARADPSGDSTAYTLACKGMCEPTNLWGSGQSAAFHSVLSDWTDMSKDVCAEACLTNAA